jgi:hypothetical protein
VSATVEVLERGRRLTFSFEDVLRYHGGGSPGGAAIALKVLERALPLLSPDGPCERREIVVDTAFAGPGARDAFELITRAVTERRFRLLRELARPDLGPLRESFVFRLTHRGRTVTLVLRDGFVSEEFLALARTPERSAEQEAHLDALKAQLAGHVLERAADEVLDVDAGARTGQTVAQDGR